MKTAEEFYMQAQVTHVDTDGSETIAVNGHEIQFGYGSGGGDGYCYAHGSFQCLLKLSKEEQEAVKNAKPMAKEES